MDRRASKIGSGIQRLKAAGLARGGPWDHNLVMVLALLLVGFFAHSLGLAIATRASGHIRWLATLPSVRPLELRILSER